MNDSNAVFLYDANGNPLAISSGDAVGTTKGLVIAGSDGTNFRFLKTDTDGSPKGIVRGGAKGTTVAADVTSEAIDINTQGLHVKVVGGSGGTPQDVNVAKWIGSIAPSVGQKAMASALPVVIASDQSPIPITSSPTSSTPGIAFGQVTTTTSTPAAVRKTTYTEQAADAQRSIVSSSASDTNTAGTGARQVKITYYTYANDGPYTETISLNGTTPVNTVATDICYIDEMVVVSVGTGGSNAGTITLYSTTGGGGTAIGTIAIGDNRTLWALHYVASGLVCRVTGLSCSNSSTTTGGGSIFTLRDQLLPVGTNPDVPDSESIRVFGQSSNIMRPYSTPLYILGPRRLQVWVTAEGSTSTVHRAAIDFYDETAP